jgi:hypothetical protein
MIGSILGTLDLLGFDRLIRVRKFFYAFFGRVLDMRELLRIAGLSATLRTYLPGSLPSSSGWA